MLSPENRRQALALIAAGNSLKKTARQLGIGIQVIQRIKQTHPKEYDAAMLEGFEIQADSLVDCHEELTPYQARVYSENIKWLLARRMAAKYGDRLDITAGVTTVDIAQALRDARARAQVETGVVDAEVIVNEPLRLVSSDDSAADAIAFQELID